jgi:hypothetical protein
MHFLTGLFFILILSIFPFFDFFGFDFLQNSRARVGVGGRCVACRHSWRLTLEMLSCQWHHRDCFWDQVWTLLRCISFLRGVCSTILTSDCVSDLREKLKSTKAVMSCVVSIIITVSSEIWPRMKSRHKSERRLQVVKGCGAAVHVFYFVLRGYRVSCV